MSHTDLRWTDEHDLAELDAEQAWERWQELARIAAVVAARWLATLELPMPEEQRYIREAEAARLRQLQLITEAVS